MAFQQSTSEDSAPANAQYLISFGGIVDSPGAYTDNQAIEPASSLITPRSDTLLAGEIVPWPVSERCLLAPPANLRGASRRGDVGSMVIRCLPSSSDYDASHPSLDAHSAPPRADLVESESFVFGELGLFSVCFVTVSGLWRHGDAFVCGLNMCPQLFSHAT